MQRVYFISGLGANRRLFDFLDLSFCEPVLLDWITPLKNETLRNYAMRLRALMPEKNPVIVGVSFGGMLAAEIAKAEPLAKVIIISSNKTSKEFPRYLRIGNQLPLYELISGNMLKKASVFSRFIFGTKTKQQKELIKEMIEETDADFMKWAIGAILKWESPKTSPNIIHIHGTADKLLPYKLVKADYTIKKGTHTMVIDKAAEISAILKKIL